MTKQRALLQVLHQQQDGVIAAALLRQLRPFIGPTNPKRCKNRTLPMIRDAEGHICTYHAEAVATWVQFLQDMEFGQRLSYPELRAQWIDELKQFQLAACKLSQLPTLTDLELALRRVPLGRASGPDGLPGEICRYHPAIMAKPLYAPLLKMLVHGHEPLGFKGGRLTPAYKGRGAKDDCTSYRSLLVSNHLGKVLHRTIRQQ